MSLAVVDGNPAIAYYGQTVSDFKYIRSTTSTGANAADWSELVKLIEDYWGMGWEASLAFVNGCPAISYCDYTNGNLMYIQATTSTGADAADWAAAETVDGPDEVGLYTSLAVVNDNPAISYYDSTNGSLKYAYYQT